MSEIYIAFADTPGFFAGIIRRVIRQKYIHVALALDPFLRETYSIGRRHPAVPLIAGFEREDKRKILRVFPEADYMVCSISCTAQQKEYIKEELHKAMRKRFRYHYAVAGLPFILMESPFIRKIISPVLPISQNFWRRPECAGGINIFPLLRQGIFMNMVRSRKSLKDRLRNLWSGIRLL